ncbi:GGDEF domain-containing protein [Acinetobacter haemolyticus]|uniref:diguanylate cyclase n=1 Tax=Acinetobacter haemolyticus TaxID=29430 RepID=A0AAJ3D9Q8_ACIHA|nr:GGDEF domain-containing protein [Acinetobacter haemolyticus]NAR28988.1 diguanylate cyclase [Acinetobacter haemolyticus]NAR73944.1 diguanylate cyclase [Acinetobacter haemolyticus]NAR77156.1 diguanylate cyclase [Acinetobacter haemolyticus]NCU24288.1 GGDEF domain-containing protein [Acinetobacter haemolyticus]
MMKVHFKSLAKREKWNFSQLWEHEPLINWDMLKKSILLLILTALMSLFGILWDSFVLLNPSTWQWVNLPLVRSKLLTNLIMLIVFLSLIIACYFYKDRVWVQEIIPILSVQIVTVLLCHTGYLIGSFSPATMVTYASIVGVGLILFDRRMIYCALIPATIAMLFCNFLSMYGILQYAPIFNPEILNQAEMHPFWVGSMFFFLLPILLACLYLFEILLQQWRTRETAIQALSRLDPLTNVMNRRSISNHLEKLNKQPNSFYSVVLLDLDHFKNINDEFGHSMGDQVLVHVAKCLSNNVRDQDLIGRFGGEEFILLLPNTTAIQAKNVAERCRLAIADMCFITEDQQQFSVSASFGISSSLNANEPHLVVSQADQALYAVKASGRNNIQIFGDLLAE